MLKLTGWAPKSVIALRDYSGKKFAADLAAGVTVGLVALPLSMAFAIASGAPPEAGLYTAVLAGFAISALGGSLISPALTVALLGAIESLMSGWLRTA